MTDTQDLKQMWLSPDEVELLRQMRTADFRKPRTLQPSLEQQESNNPASASGIGVMGLSFSAADSVVLQALGGIQAQQPASVPCVSIIDEILSDLAQVKTTLDDFQAGQYPKAVDDLLKLVAHIVVDIVLPLVKAGNREEVK
jgi:hypothetical protein